MVSGALLAQARPGGTSAVEAYVAPAAQRVEVTRIVVANTTGSAVAMSLFHDDAGGDTFTAATALYFAKSVPANDSIVIAADAVGTGFPLSAGGQIGIQTATADALTFSVYGVIDFRAAQ